MWSQSSAQVLVVVGGYLDPASAEVAAAVADDATVGVAADVLVWDERDVTDRWASREGVFVVRNGPVARRLRRRGLVSAAAFADRVALRAYFLRHRRSAVVLVGRVALGASPWLVANRGPRVWLPTWDDVGPDVDGVVVQPTRSGGPHLIVTADRALHESPLRDRSDDRWRWLPGWSPTPPATRESGDVVAVGLPDRRHGIDLVGRSLAAHSEAIREFGGHLRWLAPLRATIPPEEAADLGRLGVDDLIDVVGVIDPTAALARVLADRADRVAAVVLAARCSMPLPDDPTLIHAYHHGVRFVCSELQERPDLPVQARWTFAAPGDTAALGDALLRALSTPATARPPGPIGTVALVDLVRRS